MSVKEIPEWRLSYLAFSYSYPYLVNPESLLGVRLLIAIKPCPDFTPKYPASTIFFNKSWGDTYHH